ncbi:MAG: hypothetical protein FRX48_07853 [Lasallia pustulata]|uniref:Uncharacterized protein n=1 Tax=Lasallia pustulata TaxID=136370 RepID=A0A5M8PHK3_9LECA|nr:MAG: hypothetical protein FRX48_07853 [Lasallia pustulata]
MVYLAQTAAPLTLRPIASLEIAPLTHISQWDDEDASTWTLPNGLFIEENGTIINVSGSGDLVNFKNVFGAISNISLIMTRDFYNYSEPLPAECILYFCVKTFNATVQNGVLTENVISNAIPHIRSGII